MAGEYSQSTGNSVSTGVSSSSPEAIQTPQSDWALQLSQAVAGMGDYVFNWAQGQFQQASQVTDQQISQFNSAAQQGLGLAGNAINQYENIYEPLQNEYVQEAGSYASTPRIQYNMGAAESATEQAGAQGEQNAEQQLQSYGIDPSSGRYAELLESQEAAKAAAAAGAGQQSEINTQNTGRQMLLNSIEIGQQLPGQAVNELNSAYQGISGAENAELGLENTGANMFDAANPYLSTAMQLKYPGIGQQSSSANQSHDNKQANSSPGNQNQGAGSGAGGRGGAGQYGADAQDTAGMGNEMSGGSNLALPKGGSGGSIAKTITGLDQGNDQNNNQNQGSYGAFDADANPVGGAFANWQGDQTNPFTDTTGQSAYDTDDVSPSVNQTYSQSPWAQDQMNGQNPITDTSAGQNFDPSTSMSVNPGVPGMPGSATTPGAPAGDTGSDPWGGTSGNASLGSAQDQGSYQGPFQNAQDPGSDAGSDFSQPQQQPQQQSQGGDYNGLSQDTGGAAGGYGGYSAGGGVMPMGPAFARGGNMTTGGHVPASASPSGGRNTDDIPARLNAKEFVIPRDVAEWKGQEFFQKLIEQSRAARYGAPAKPKAKAPLPGNPKFVSRKIGAQPGPAASHLQSHLQRTQPQQFPPQRGMAPQRPGAQ